MSRRTLNLLTLGLFLLIMTACGGNEVTPGTVTVSISPQQVTLAPDASHTFTAPVTGASDTSVTWTATDGTVDGTGNTVTYTAPSEDGSYTLTATSNADTSKQATATITVTSEPDSSGPSTTLQVTPAAVTFTKQGQSKVLEVKAYNEEGEEVAVPSDLEVGLVC